MTRNSWSRHIGLAAGIALIAIVLSSTSAGPAIAQTFKPVMSFIVNDVTSPVPVRAVASNLTHVGRPVNDLVHLRWFNGSDRQCFIRSGDSTATCYAPEMGHTLVVTDVSWYFQKSSTPGRVGQFVLFSTTGFDYETFASTTDGLTFVGSDHFQTGFVYRPDLQPLDDFGDIFGVTVNLYGYLVPSA